MSTIRDRLNYIISPQVCIAQQGPRHESGRVGFFLLSHHVHSSILSSPFLPIHHPIMRSAFKTLLVLTSIAVAFAHSEQALPRRKSLGFGPTLPHATFTTSPPAHLTISSSFASSDPFDVARSFLNNLLSDLDSEHTNYVIREDSYTDTRNGVTHVYANQYVNGLEVTDGRININIKDGKVLSYGDSVSGNLLRVSHTRNLNSRFILIVLPRFSSISWQYGNTLYPRAFLRHSEWQD